MTRSLSRNPLYQQIADILREEIAADYQLGDRLPSDLALAKRFSTSNVTVREAMLSLSQEGIVERRQGSGTYVCAPQTASALSRGAGTPHVAIWTELNISNPWVSSFYSRTIQHAQVYLEKQGIRAKLYWGRNEPWVTPEVSTCPELWEDLGSGRVRGVIALGANPAWVEHLGARGIPVVGWQDEYPYRVSMNDGATMEQAVRYLASRGRRKIALLRWWSPELSAEVSDPMANAFEAVMGELDLPVCRDWLRQDLHPSVEGAGWAEFREVWTAKPEKPDGLIITDDLLYRDAAMAILDMRLRVPDDLLVVAYANKGSGIFYPFPTARIELDLNLVAREMCGMLAVLLEGGSVSQHLEMPYRWVDDPSATTKQSGRRGRRGSAKHR